MLCQRVPSAESSPATYRPAASVAVTSVMRPPEPSAVISRGLSGSAFLPLPTGALKEICSAASYGLAESG